MTKYGPMRSSEGPASSTRDTMLAQKFVSLADTLVDDFDVVDLMDNLVHTCVDLLGVTAAGLLLTDQRGSLQLVASTSEKMRLLELFQLQSDEGPCLDCVRTGSVVSVDDLGVTSDRWPRFSAAATRAGYRSIHALPLRLRSETIGGLNLFRYHSPQLSIDDQRIAQALADVATIGLLQQRSSHRASMLAEQLQSTLNSRIVVEQAKGVLAEYGHVDMETAYDALRRYSRNHHVKLSELADYVVQGQVSLASVLSADEPR